MMCSRVSSLRLTNSNPYRNRSLLRAIASNEMRPVRGSSKVAITRSPILRLLASMLENPPSLISMVRPGTIPVGPPVRSTSIRTDRAYLWKRLSIGYCCAANLLCSFKTAVSVGWLMCSRCIREPLSQTTLGAIFSQSVQLQSESHRADTWVLQESLPTFGPTLHVLRHPPTLRNPSHGQGR